MDNIGRRKMFLRFVLYRSFTIVCRKVFRRSSAIAQRGAVLGAGGPAESSLTGSAEQQLRSVRTEFVKRVSGPVLNELLDRLLQHTVINQEEMESVEVIAERTEKARDIIDMVLRKGN
ncbi:caspase-1-like [Oncorhynchus keta]|uniref:caspase-1-like n=1 Tax=Oncorhynchus keta TaxID=8018 RepID=UPI00227CA53B|nr:caspase-1-like [Oncorhynchus keta]